MYSKNRVTAWVSFLLILHLGSLGALAQAPAVGPQPIATPAPAPTTIGELQTLIRVVLRRPEVEAAQFAVKIASLETGRTLFEENATKLLKPASNLKLYTVAAALARLSPNFRFKTSVYAAARPDASGTLRGDLTVYGRGDPSIAASYNDGDYFKGIDALATRIAAAGVKRVDGDLVGDETHFAGPPFGSGWEWDDLQWEYGAEISSLTVNDNVVDFFVQAGSQPGAACRITLGPPTSLLTIINRTTTSARGSKRNLIVYRHPGESVFAVGGSLPLEDPGYTANVSVPKPALLFVTMLRTSLEKLGIAIKGRTRTVDARAERTSLPPPVSGFAAATPASGINNAPPGALVELASLESPPLAVIAADTLKPSQNLYTELVLRALGKTGVPDPSHDSAQAGIAAVKSFLIEAGINSAKIQITDGSGLSRNNLVTADATLRLLTYMARHPYANVFRDALPIAGVGGTLRRDGTLRNRMRDTPAANTASAKTGSLDGVATLSGYVTSAAGEPLVSL
ncbi:MAG: D-alanyl-D-alanine carboxypeptidase/D-alanyl-D-alanine-endopeptidase [Pyrinomonadaceae bacterium]